MGGKITNQDYSSRDGVISYTYPVINAIDIDWGVAYLANHGAYIRHSGDLLDFIDNMKTGVDASEIEEIISYNINIPKNLSDLNNDVGYITASALRQYVTFDDIRNNDSLRGLSAYEIAQRVYEENGRVFPYASEAEWIESLGGTDIDINEIYGQIEEIARRTTTLTSVEIDGTHSGLTLSYSYNDSYSTISYVIGLTNSFLPADIFNEAYEKLYDRNSYASIAYITREVLAYELIPAYAKETLDTLEEISYWIQQHPDEYNYIISNIEILHDNLSYIHDELDETIPGTLAYNVAQLDIDKLITVKVDAEANKIESITVNNEIQDIYELDDEHKKNVNIDVPIIAIYDNTLSTFSYINTETHVAYIGAHKYDTDDIITTGADFIGYNPTTETTYHMSLTDALSIVNNLAKMASDKVDEIIAGTSGVNSIDSDGSITIDSTATGGRGDVTLSATGKTVPLGYDMTSILGGLAISSMSLTDAISILGTLQKTTQDKVDNHEERITALEEDMSYIGWQIIN